MCGIVGILGGLEDKQRIVRVMSNLIKHRGPDDNGFYDDKSISLGHRRLSVIDLSEKGHQPMTDEDQSLVIVFNGEIYNFKEIRKDLEKKGHSFKSNTDTEVLLYAYKEWGLDCIKKLNGMYAFAIWDKLKKTLCLVRDPAGIKPLYYSFKKNIFCFSSEIKALVQSGMFKPKLNEESLKKFFFYRYIPGKETIFQNVFKLLPGDIITIKAGNISIQNVRSEFKEELLGESEKEIILKLKKRLKSAVKYRLISDVPVGTFLSGGIDSSGITAMTHLITNKKVDSYSVEFDTNDFAIKSEIKYAKILSNHFNVYNHVLIVKEKEVISKLPLIAWHYDEPMGDAAVVPTFFVSKLAKNNVRVVLAGEGGDEQFGGYTKYGNMIRLFKDSENISSEELSKAYMEEISVFMPYQIEKLFINFDKEIFEKKTIDFLETQFQNLKEKNFLNKMLFFDQRTMLCENYFMKADKMSMAHGLEERLPFLDKQIIELSSVLNQSFKIRGGNEKYILKKSFENFLPNTIIKRKKQGYGTPTDEWFKNEVGELFNKRIDKSEAFKKYFNTDYIKNLLNNHLSGKENNNTKLWSLLSFDLWYEIYIVRGDKKPIESYGSYLEIN